MENNTVLDSLKISQNLMESKSYEDAEKVLKDVILHLRERSILPERNRLLSEAYNNLGFIYYKKVEFNMAQSYYTKSIETNKFFAPAYYNRGVIYYRLGVFNSAVKDLELAVSFQPTNEEFHVGFKACRDQINKLSS